MADKLTLGQVRDYLNQGKTPEDIQKITGASEIVIKAHLTRLKHQGYKQPQRQTPENPTKTKAYSFDTLDEAIDFWINTLEQAKKVPSLEKLVSDLTQEVNRLNLEKSQLSQATLQETEKRYQEAVRN
jgi:hypothetical protein